VAWLFLLSYWIAAIIAASFVYSLWNRGLEAAVRVAEIRHTGEVMPSAAADIVAGPFETDELTVELSLRARKGTRGPFRVRLEIGDLEVDLATGVVTRAGYIEKLALPSQRRGTLAARDWRFESGDPLGLFVLRGGRPDDELALVLPRFTSLAAQPLVRELEASVTAPRAGSGTEIFGVREYRPGDALRRIHWRSTARRGELIVREFEPPGVQNLGIFLDSHPSSTEAADQIARLAASEAWDCLRADGRVTLWAPGCEATRPDEQRNLQALLEWLARYPKAAADDEPAPLVGDAIAITANSDARLLDAVEDVRAHGGAVRGWVVGDKDLESDIEVRRVGLEWPL
jgi:uncharacterized protein (DUF58 family)